MKPKRCYNCRKSMTEAEVIAGQAALLLSHDLVDWEGWRDCTGMEDQCIEKEEANIIEMAVGRSERPLVGSVVVCVNCVSECAVEAANAGDAY